MTQPQRKKRHTISTNTITQRHPLNVKPSGNALLSTNEDLIRQRNDSMGDFGKFPDELVLDILALVDDPKDLLNLGHCSRVMYAFTYDEDLWRKLYMRLSSKEEAQLAKEGKQKSYPLCIEKWLGSWRKTLLGLEKEAKLELPNGLLCSDLLFRPFQCSNVDYLSLFKDIIHEEKQSYHLQKTQNQRFGIERIKESDLTQELFDNEYYLKPFILSKTSGNRWPAWDVDYLNNRFPDVKFRQESVQWPLHFYTQYYHSNKDESPLYLFDCQSEAMAQLSKEYDIPSIFKYDYFKLFNQEIVKTRPDHRWIIIGPSNSGSTFHKDPNATSAWNANLCGMKLWIMTQPGIKPPGIDTDITEGEVTAPVGITEWVLSGFYNDSLKLAEQGKCQIGITFPGEVMYVPSGWWHSVINLEGSVALTQNFVPKGNLATVLKFLRDKRDQISGFHIREFVASLKAHLKENNDEVSEENKALFEDFLSHVGEYELNDEDIGELKLSIDLPIYEFFIELIENSAEYKDHLSNALLELKELDRKDQKDKSPSVVVPSKKWENLTNTVYASESPFSFNFEESDGE